MGLFNRKKWKIIDPSLIKGACGVINGQFFSNPHLNIDTTLFYGINIELEPFRFRGTEERTKAVLDFIKLPVKNYCELENRSFTFTLNPKGDNIEASIYFEHAHNMLDIGRLNFKGVNNKEIGIVFDGDLTLEENPGVSDRIHIESRLKFGNITVNCDKMAMMNNEQFKEYAYSFISREKYIFDENARCFVPI